MRKLPNPDGSAIGGSIETWLPIVDWSDDEVFDFLKARGIARIRYYDHKPRGPECATCPAGWGEGRGAYLREHHPDLAERYAGYLKIHAAETAPVVDQFFAEWRALGSGVADANACSVAKP